MHFEFIFIIFILKMIKDAGIHTVDVSYGGDNELQRFLSSSKLPSLC